MDAVGCIDARPLRENALLLQAPAVRKRLPGVSVKTLREIEGFLNSHSTSASRQVDDGNDHRNNEQNVDKASGQVEAPTEQPQHQQNRENRPKHIGSPGPEGRWHTEVRICLMAVSCLQVQGKIVGHSNIKDNFQDEAGQIPGNQVVSKKRRMRSGGDAHAW